MLKAERARSEAAGMSDAGLAPTSESLAAIAAALRQTTEALAAELGKPGTPTPAWSSFEWRIATAAVAIHGAGGLLAGAARWHGPPGWHAFLGQQRTAIEAHVARGRALLAQIDDRARAAGLRLRVLKGGALYAQGLYAPGERPMADIDLLTSEADLAACGGLLAQLGYRPGWTTWKHVVFESAAQRAPDARALGEQPGHPVKVELHTTLREVLPVRAVDLSALAQLDGVSAGVSGYPSAPLQVLHVLLHAAGSMIHRGLRLVHLTDIARLVRPLGAAGWDDLFRTAAATRDPSLWWAYPPLSLANRYFHCVPAEILARLERATPGALRQAVHKATLTDVSLSALWIQAFPGIEWSRSLRERAGYALRRVVPSRETRALRSTFAEIAPPVLGGRWSQTSQWRRIVRFALSRQPRQETLQPVHAALAADWG
ncbi:MAG: nucleotidyltransferase family protein [Gammaproteobacteria bacterium]|nr:nucleotidyltransferase family protein [Gammaproteobacteria bacterium]